MAFEVNMDQNGSNDWNRESDEEDKKHRDLDVKNLKKHKDTDAEDDRKHRDMDECGRKRRERDKDD